MISDYHVHTPYCGHAQGAIIDYVEKAIKLGIQEIGFADHLGRYYLTRTQKRRYWDWGMDERDLARYYSELQDVSDTYKDKISIKIGLEIDFIEGAEELLLPLVEQYPFDFFLGSIHCLPNIGWRHLSNYYSRNLTQIYRSYFDAVKSALSSKLFHSVAHLDFIWRYLPWPDQLSDEVMANISDTVKIAAKNFCALEINVNGLLWSSKNTFTSKDPFLHLIDEISTHNSSITIGSDAHEPDAVGRAFEHLYPLLKERGIKGHTTFSQKTPIFHSF